MFIHQIEELKYLCYRIYGFHVSMLQWIHNTFLPLQMEDILSLVLINWQLEVATCVFEYTWKWFIGKTHDKCMFHWYLVYNFIVSASYKYMTARYIIDNCNMPCRMTFNKFIYIHDLSTFDAKNIFHLVISV